MIDDHEIIAFMGNDHHLSFREIPKMLMKTEVGVPGQTSRYRPSYYLFRLIETAVWGDHPFFWYLFRVVLFGISIFIAWRLLGRVFGLLGGLSCMILVSHSFWADIWARLGSNETYGVVGVVLYCLAFSKLWEEKRSEPTTFWWIVLAFSAILTMGSKENFLLILSTSAVLLYQAWQHKRLTKLSFLTNGILFAFGLFVMTALILGLKKQGGDVYANPVAPMSRFQILIAGVFSLRQWKIQLPFWVSLILMGISALFKKYQPHDESASYILRDIKRLFWIETGLLLLWYSQFVFYNGAWPNGSRYDFPGVLALDLAYLFLAYTLIRILPHCIPYLKFPRAPQLGQAILGGFLVLVVLLFGFREFKLINAVSQRNSYLSRQFSHSLLKIVEEVKESPNTPIVFESHNVWDYEPIFSLQRFLSAYGVQNPLALTLEGWSEATCKQGFEVSLAKRLKGIAEYGDLESSQDVTPRIRFYPLQTIQQRNPCFVISFSGDSKLPCKNLGRIW